MLSGRYGISRTPMREALARLAQDRLIERSNRGYVVRRRTPEEILAIYEARIALETSAAELAADRRTVLDLGRLEHLQQLRHDAEEPATFGALNHRFHRVLRAAARSDVIDSMLEQLDDLLMVYRPDRADPETVDNSLQQHAAILQAVRDGDGAAARTVMSAHLLEMRDLRIAALIRSL